MPKQFAFIVDPMEKMIPAEDTTFAFMLAAAAKGHHVVHVLPQNVTYKNAKVYLHGERVEVFDEKDKHFQVLKKVQLEAAECQAIFIRSNPPFDEAYLNLTWILSFAEDQGVRIINSPRGLRNANEHLYGLEFAEYAPPTLVTNQGDKIRAFVEEVGGMAIAKPIDGHAGFGVLKLQIGDSNLPAIVEVLTLGGETPIIVQTYIPEAEEGDKRIILVDGQPRGAVLRVPGADDHRGNLHVGAQAKACELNPRDLEICAAMRPKLQADGLFFAGIDILGDYLIEVNVTSPTLVRELKALGGPDVAAEVIAALE
jgi:glutathione synthase